MTNLSEKYRANFLWPPEEGSIEQAGYEFANGLVEEYRQLWWDILKTRIREATIRELDEKCGPKPCDECSLVKRPNDTHCYSGEDVKQSEYDCPEYQRWLGQQEGLLEKQELGQDIYDFLVAYDGTEIDLHDLVVLMPDWLTSLGVNVAGVATDEAVVCEAISESKTPSPDAMSGLPPAKIHEQGLLEAESKKGEVAREIAEWLKTQPRWPDRYGLDLDLADYCRSKGWLA